MRAVHYLVLTLVVSFLCASAYAEPTEQELLERGLTHFDNILSKYPPEKFHVIGLGPTVVVQSAAARARLGESWEDYFSEIPVAYFNEYETLAPEIRRSLLPPASRVRDRAVVVLRVLMTGASMRHYLPDFADDIRNLGISAEVRGHFIVSDEFPMDEKFFPDWATLEGRKLPPVELVRDNAYAKWLNSRDLNSPQSSIHGQTYYQLIELDVLEENARFEKNEAAGELDQTVEFLSVHSCHVSLGQLARRHR